MRPVRAKLYLRIATACLAIAATLAGALGVLLPLDSAVTDPAQLAGSAAASIRPADAVPPLEQFAPIWLADLHPCPASDGEASPDVPQQDAGALLLHLAGTLGRTQALLSLPDGTTQALSVGETVNGVELLDVSPGQATVRYNGAVLKLAKPPEPDPLPEGGG